MEEARLSALVDEKNWGAKERLEDMQNRISFLFDRRRL